MIAFVTTVSVWGVVLTEPQGANKKGNAAASAAASTTSTTASSGLADPSTTTTTEQQPPTPTPATPITPMHQNSFASQKNSNLLPLQPPPPNPLNPSSLEPFGSLVDANTEFNGMNLDFADLGNGSDVLDTFDFDSFLETEGDGGMGGVGGLGGVGGFDVNYAFGEGGGGGVEGLEAGEGGGMP